MTPDRPEDAFNRLRRSPTFRQAIHDVESIYEPPIARYLTQVRGSGDAGPKAIKDAVWGMIDLTRDEVIVLDSPPIQRLRRVRQLGLAYLTYPTAGYSRFEHTLGAVHQADRMLRAVARRSGRAALRRGDTEDPDILSALPVVRLAAMLHDVGHMPLSHVSERFFTAAECTDRDLVRHADRLRAEVQAALDVPPPSLAEALSLVTILTPSFWGLLTRVAHYDDAEVYAAAGAIVGRAPSHREAYLSQLITNVIDADKLDYMFRDGFVTGVPLAVDLERLLFKLKVIELRREQMPEGLEAIADDESPALVLGIDAVGQRLAYDVTVARTMLFERVYLHHKTRAAERIAMRRLEEVAQPSPLLLRHGDELFGELGDRLIPAAGVRGGATAMLRDRQLPRRAYALSHTLLAVGAAAGAPGEELELPPEATEPWRRLTSALDRATQRQELEAKIRLTAQRIAAHLESDVTVTDVWVDTPPARGDQGTWDLWVQTPDGEPRPAETYNARAAAYATSPSHTFYVYATGHPDAPEIVFIATEFVFATRFGLVAGRGAADAAKVSFRRVEQLKRTLEARAPGVFDRAGRLRPEPRYLNRPPGSVAVREVTARFHHYHAQDRVRVDEHRVREFLRQFPERLGEEMLDVLSRLRFLGRDDLGRGLGELLAAGASPDERYAPLIERLDKSASHLVYYLPDLKILLPVGRLHDALSASGPITFFDDVLISGKQARTVVQRWLGLELDLPEEADLADPLSTRDVEALRARRVRFRFAYAHKPGIEALAKLTAENGLGHDIDAEIVEPHPHPLDQLLSDRQELRQFLVDVGTDLLSSTKGVENPEKWTSERCHDFALGYGNSQQLVSLFYNTPTGTLTALWKGGRFRGAPWLPLLPRRGEPAVS